MGKKSHERVPDKIKVRLKIGIGKVPTGGIASSLVLLALSVTDLFPGLIDYDGAYANTVYRLFLNMSLPYALTVAGIFVFWLSRKLRDAVPRGISNFVESKTAPASAQFAFGIFVTGPLAVILFALGLYFVMLPVMANLTFISVTPSGIAGLVYGMFFAVTLFFFGRKELTGQIHTLLAFLLLPLLFVAALFLTVPGMPKELAQSIVILVPVVAYFFAQEHYKWRTRTVSYAKIADLTTAAILVVLDVHFQYQIAHPLMPVEGVQALTLLNSLSLSAILFFRLGQIIMREGPRWQKWIDVGILAWYCLSKLLL